MPAVWFALRRTLDCKPEPSDVHDPRRKGKRIKIARKRPSLSSTRCSRSGCSRSIANLKDVISGSKRHNTMEEQEKPPIASPRSIGSNELLNPIAHEVVLSNSTCELKITGFRTSEDGNGGESVSRFEGTLKPGTPVHRKSHQVRNPNGVSTARFGGVNTRPNKTSFEEDSHGFSCHKCGEQFVKWDAVEAHHLSKHAVTELIEGDSSQRIVELIYKTSWSKSNSSSGGIERILKVHNMQKTLAQFEEHREIVKIKANKLPKKHPRCLADGNELLRFHGTTVECALGSSGSSSLCLSVKCSVCQILRNGFSLKKESNGIVGVFTTSTSESAFGSIEIPNNKSSLRKAMIVCRVIAGRVHRPLENIQELGNHSGFDSLAGKVGIHSNIEQLYLLNPRALLPCFVIICKP